MKYYNSLRFDNWEMSADVMCCRRVDKSGSPRGLWTELDFTLLPTSRDRDGVMAETTGEAKAVITDMMDAYNHVRLHSALPFLRPVDYHRGNPEALLAERRRKLQVARELGKQENIKLRQRLIPWTEDRTVSYSEPAFVSL